MEEEYMFEKEEDRNAVAEFTAMGMIILMVLPFVTLFLGFINEEVVFKELSDLRYTTDYDEEQVKIEVLDIIKEKGKETQYVVKCLYGETTIPESIYVEYIGEDNNTVTIRVAEAHIYIGYIYPFGIPTDFSTDWHDLKGVYEKRISWAWEESVKPFTEDEVKELAYLYLNGEIETNFSASGLSKDAKEFSK